MRSGRLKEIKEAGARRTIAETHRRPWNIPGLDPLRASSKSTRRLPLCRVLRGLEYHLADCQNPLLAFEVSAPHDCRWCVGQACDVCPLLCCMQGQGALSERLRSFSMQDLTTIRGDGAPAPSSPPPPGSGRASGKHGQPKMSRSASESAGSSGRCHFPLPPFRFGGLAFTASGPVHHAVWNLELPSTQMSVRSCQAGQEAEHHTGQDGCWPGDADRGQD